MLYVLVIAANWFGRLGCIISLPSWSCAACQGNQAQTGYMGRIIGTIIGAILAIWLVVTVAGGIFATLKTFLIIALIAMAVFVVVWLVARGFAAASRRSRGAAVPGRAAGSGQQAG